MNTTPERRNHWQLQETKSTQLELQIFLSPGQMGKNY